MTVCQLTRNYNEFKPLTFTRWPESEVGENLACRAALTAAACNNGWPDTGALPAASSPASGGRHTRTRLMRLSK